MEENQKNVAEAIQTEKDVTSDNMQTEQSQDTKNTQSSLFEGIYDKLPDISVRSVDRFIILCIIAFIAVILIGVLRANHVF
ncbi:MAG: hypothetical protein K2P65_02530 [Lachnospiraceae bacterium]|nr:hypothetical protein [Lachnospiraceae bacterium]